MAAGDITYGTAAALADVSRLHSNADGVAEAFGEIDNGTTAAPFYNIHIVVPINSSATGGSYTLYLVESHDGVEWTDNIDPATSGDVAAKLADAKVLKVASTVYNATHRTEAEFYVSLNMLELAEFVGFVLLNESGQTIPASGADGDSVSLKVS